MSAEKIYKGSIHWLSELLNTIVSLAKVIFFSQKGIRMPEAKSNTCIVLGNGPSLSGSLQKHPDFFQKHELACVNNFAVAAQYTELKPEYYIMLDPAYWPAQPKESFVNDTFRAIAEKTDWNMHLFLPFQAKHSAPLNNWVRENKNIHIHFFNYTVFKGFQGIAESMYKKNLAMPQSQNVMVAALFLCINTGFKEIFLVGADHSWHQNLHVNEENILCIKDVHFYENEEKVNYRIFYKTQLDYSREKEVFKMHEIFHTLGKMFYGYEVVNAYALKRGVNIYNASEISFVDSFKRIKL